MTRRFANFISKTEGAAEIFTISTFFGIDFMSWSVCSMNKIRLTKRFLPKTKNEASLKNTLEKQKTS